MRVQPTLRLGFEVDAGRLGQVLRWFQQPIEAEGGLLDLLRDEAVAVRFRHGEAGQLEDQGRVGLEQAVEEGVGFHGGPGVGGTAGSVTGGTGTRESLAECRVCRFRNGLCVIDEDAS